MPATFVVETGAGLTNSNSYCTVEFADQYHIDNGNPSTWSDIAAAGAIYATAISDSQTITIDGVVYTWKNTLSSTQQVKIGTSVQDSLQNLANALDLTGDKGVQYSADIVQHPTVKPGTPGASSLSLIARVAGTSGNSIAISSTLTLPSRVLSATLLDGYSMKEEALKAATAYLDRVYASRWVERKNVQGQALEWPRAWVVDKDDYPIGSDEIPVAVKKATAYVALRYIEGVALLVDETADTPSVVESSVRVGPISISERMNSAVPTRTSFPDVTKMLVGLVSPAGRIFRG